MSVLFSYDIVRVSYICCCFFAPRFVLVLNCVLVLDCRVGAGAGMVVLLLMLLVFVDDGVV